MKLIFKTFAVKFWELREQLRVRKAFYLDDKFRKVDIALAKAYNLKNPYTISRQFLQKRGSVKIHTYGETPLITMYRIVNKFGISATHRILELGCGRGRIAFFLSHFIGCRVVGVDFVPEFITKAKQICANPNLQFFCQDISQIDPAGFDFIYLCGTCLEDDVIKNILEKIPNETKIITISYPASDYNPKFQTQASFEGYFPWGSTTIFLSGK